MIGRGAALVVLMISAPAWAGGQAVIPDYDTAREDYFWPLLYDVGGETVYCAQPFEAGEEATTDGFRVTVEHAYPASWIAGFHGCPNRDECDVDAFHHAAADLHNLWPALQGVNSSRSNLPFGVLPGEDERRFTEKCPDFERSSGDGAVVEPRDAAKGDLARSLLYMSDQYGLPLHGMETMLLRWHIEDPPSAMEWWRGYAIEWMQGTANRYVVGGE